MKQYEELMVMDRPFLHHVHMDHRRRAKQFAPFAALNGFEDGIAAQEILYVDRPLLSEERQEELDRKLHILRVGGYVKVLYFQNCMPGPDKGQIKEAEGIVDFFEPDIGMRIHDTEICIRDILSLKSDIFGDSDLSVPDESYPGLMRFS